MKKFRSVFTKTRLYAKKRASRKSLRHSLALLLLNVGIVTKLQILQNGVTKQPYLPTYYI